MKSILKRIIESIALIAISAALWQLMLFPVANNVNKKLPLSPFQNFLVIFGIGLLIFLINWYAEKQGYLNWKEVWTDSSVKKMAGIWFCSYFSSSHSFHFYRLS